MKDLKDDKLQIEAPKSIPVYSYDNEDKNGKLFVLKGQSE